MTTSERVELYREMAELTKEHCITRKKCMSYTYYGNRDNLCCSLMYCKMAEKIAKDHGVELKPVNQPDPDDPCDRSLPYLTDEKKCIVPPHFRPLCTLHVCDRLLFEDSEFSEKYFELRERLAEADPNL